jgi:hypothetical protein
MEMICQNQVLAFGRWFLNRASAFLFTLTGDSRVLFGSFVMVRHTKLQN